MQRLAGPQAPRRAGRAQCAVLGAEGRLGGVHGPPCLACIRRRVQSLRHSVVAPPQARRIVLSSERLSRSPPAEKRARLRGSGCSRSSAERARAGRTANAAHRGGLGVVLGLPRLRRARPQPVDRPRVPGCEPRRAALAPRPHNGAACHPAGYGAVPDLLDAALLPWRSLPLSAAACGPAHCAGRRPHTGADDAALQ